VIQLFSTIETAFNSIWGVKRGRNWLLRIAFYWAAVTLGAVLALASLALLSASAFVSTIESLPMGAEIRQMFIWAGPAVSMVVLTGLLTVFYKFIPNTSVNWWPAFTGAVVVVILLYANNLMAFLYLRNVTLNQSLFGALGVLPVLMLGLYVFWLIVLLGGQITYATQNANYRSSHLAWNELNIASQRGLALLILTLVSRRFRDCRKAYDATLSWPCLYARERRLPYSVRRSARQNLAALFDRVDHKCLDKASAEKAAHRFFVFSHCRTRTPLILPINYFADRRGQCFVLGRTLQTRLIGGELFKHR
jgi:hypothetical protein